MTRLGPVPGQPQDFALDDDRLVAVAAPRMARSRLWLVWFTRVIAFGWLVKGLMAWAAIIGVGYATSFDNRPEGYQATLIYFAVVDIVAAVALWLTAHWGGILWLLAVMSHLVLAVFFPRFVPNSALVIALLIISMMSYLTISWLASLEE